MSGIQVQADFSKLEKLLSSLKKKHFVDVGILGAGPSREEGLSNAQIGAVHEFGSISQGIPERSFINLGITHEAKKIHEAAEKVFDQALKTDNIPLIFQRIGLAGEAAIHAAFDTQGFGTWPALSEDYKTRPSGQPVTSASKPLQDTGALEQAITSKVGG